MRRLVFVLDLAWNLTLRMLGICRHTDTVLESVGDVLHLTCETCGHRAPAVSLDVDLTARRERLIERMNRVKADIAAAKAAQHADTKAAALGVDLPEPKRVTQLRRRVS